MIGTLMVLAHQTPDLKSIPWDMFPGWMTKLSNGEAIHISDVSKIPDSTAEKEMLLRQGIKSALVLPL